MGGGAKKAAKRAANIQIRNSRGVAEEAARQRSEQVTAGRRLRGAGRRALAFMGVETGLAPTLGG